MKVTVSELIQMLEDVEQQHGDVEVRFAHQPAYPLQVWIADDLAVFEPENGPVVVYLAEKNHSSNDYLPGDVAEQLGWKS